MKNLNDILKTIDLLQSEIDAHGELDTDLAKRIEYKFRLDWNYFSNAMEGNSLTRIETKQLMMDNVTIAGKPFKDISEMRGHDNEVLEILKVGKGQARISEKRIKSMHQAIMHEDDPAKQAFIGKWKSVNNKVTNFRGEIYDFVPYEEVPEAIHKLINKTNAEIDAVQNGKKDAKHPAQIAFEFHIEYVRIHPFYDGNGRTARLLTNLLLISFGYPPFLLSLTTKDSYNRILGEIQGYGGEEKDFHVFLGNLLIESQSLVLDAIAGKNISDDNDVDKEIMLFKQSLSNSDVELKVKDNNLIAEALKKTLLPLLELFLRKHEQFDDFFKKKELISYIQDVYRESNSLELFDDWLESRIEIKKLDNMDLNPFKDIKLKLIQEFKSTSLINELGLKVNYFGFKKNGENIFDDFSEIKIVFNQYKYSVADENGDFNDKLQKFYSQSYTEQEMMEIVNEKAKTFLEKLKSRMKD